MGVGAVGREFGEHFSALFTRSDQRTFTTAHLVMQRHLLSVGTQADGSRSPLERLECAETASSVRDSVKSLAQASRLAVDHFLPPEDQTSVLAADVDTAGIENRLLFLAGTSVVFSGKPAGHVSPGPPGRFVDTEVPSCSV